MKQALCLLSLFIAFPAQAQASSIKDLLIPPLQPGMRVTVEWADGDSGWARELESGEVHAFRIKDWDAPGTVPVSWNRETKCAAERNKGYKAKKFMENMSEGQELIIGENYGRDRTGDRWAVDLMLDGRNVALKSSEFGHMKHWPHDDNVPLSPKPVWCGE